MTKMKSKDVVEVLEVLLYGAPDRPYLQELYDYEKNAIKYAIDVIKSVNKDETRVFVFWTDHEGCKHVRETRIYPSLELAEKFVKEYNRDHEPYTNAVIEGKRS